MKIKSTFTEEREINIIVPMFLKSKYYYYAVINEQTEMSILDTGDAVSVRNTKPDGNDIARNIQSMEPCSEQEFFYALDQAILKLSLKPVLHEPII